MDRIGVRVPAAILAAVATFGVLAGIATLAEVESPYGMHVVELPRVVVTASSSALLADSCGAEVENSSESSPCLARQRTQLGSDVF